MRAESTDSHRDVGSEPDPHTHTHTHVDGESHKFTTETTTTTTTENWGRENHIFKEKVAVLLTTEGGTKPE